MFTYHNEEGWGGGGGGKKKGAVSSVVWVYVKELLSFRTRVVHKGANKGRTDERTTQNIPTTISFLLYLCFFFFLFKELIRLLGKEWYLSSTCIKKEFSLFLITCSFIRLPDLLLARVLSKPKARYKSSSLVIFIVLLICVCSILFSLLLLFYGTIYKRRVTMWWMFLRGFSPLFSFFVFLSITSKKNLAVGRALLLGV